MVFTVERDPDSLTHGSQPRNVIVAIAAADEIHVKQVGYVPVLKVAFNVSSSDLRAAQKVFPCTFLPAPAVAYTPHADLFLQAAYLEARAFAIAGTDALVHSYTNRVVCDLANARREFPPHSSLLPAYTKGFLSGRTCAHGPLDCDCEHPTHCYFGLDPGSYTPEAIATLLSRTLTGSGYAIFPKLHNIAGAIGKTLTYYCPERGIIAFKYNDGPEHRVIDPMFIHGSYHGGAFTLFAKPLESTSEFTLYELEYYAPAEPGYEPTYPVEKWTSLEDAAAGHRSYTLPTTTAVGQTTVFQWAEFGLREIHLYSNYAVFSTASSKQIVFSREIAWQGARYFSGQPRNGVLLNKVTRWVTGQYGRLVNLPEHLKYSAQLATVVFVMSHCVPDEASALGDLVRKSQAAWAVHAETVAFRPPIDLTPQRLVGGIVYLGLSTYTAHEVGSQTLVAVGAAQYAQHTATPFVVHHAAAVKAIATTTAFTGGVHIPLVVPVWCFVTCAAVAYDWYIRHRAPDVGPEISTWAATHPDEQPPILPTGVYHIPFTLKFGATERVKTTIPPQQEGSLVRLPAVPEFPPKAPTQKVSLLGAAFTEIPRYFENTSENQAIALMNRLTLDTPAPVPGLWPRVAQAYLAHPFEQRLTQLLREPDSEFFLTRDSVARWAAKFPPSRRSELLSAYDDWKRDGCRFKSTDFIASSFVKGELHVKPDFLTDDNPAPQPLLATARSIISFKPVLNATLGPVVAHFAEFERAFRKDALADDLCPLMPDGISGELVGQWLTSWVAHFGGPEAVVTVCLDSEKFDAHNSEPSLEAGRTMSVRRLVIRQRSLLQAFEAQGHIRGRSLGGVRFLAEHKRCSGSSDTSLGNTKETEAKACFQVEPLIVDAAGYHFNFDNLGVNYAVAARGDDGYLVIRKSWLLQELPVNKVAEQFARRALHLGFKDTVGVFEGVDGDFCSRWWYPVGGVYLPGGKIGRTLAKAGFFFDAPKDFQTVRSAAIGALQDNYHVPFLREYFARVVAIASKQRMPMGGRPPEYAIHMSEKHEYDETTLAFVEKKYGLTAQDLLDFNTLLAGIKSLPVVISWPRLHECIRVDSA